MTTTTMHRLAFLALCLPGGLQAAETLGPAGLESTYIPVPAESIPCPAGKADDIKQPKCSKTTPPTKSLTDKALRDAEHQFSDQVITNPQLSNPDLSPPPLNLPPVQLPTPQQLLDQWNNRPLP